MSDQSPKKNPVGRPREYDRDQIALDMLEWAAKPDTLYLNEFCATHDPKIAPRRICDWCKEDDFFRDSYDIVCAHLAWKREKALITGHLHVKAYDLNAKVYDYFLKIEEMEHAKYLSSLKAQEIKPASVESLERFDAFMAQLHRIQEAKDFNKKSTESTS